MNLKEKIAGIREYADWLEANPRFAELLKGDVCGNFCLLTQNKAVLAEAARMLGTVKKNDDGQYIYIERMFGDFKVQVNVRHDIACERVVVGTKIVPAEPEKIVVVPAKPERVEEIVQWKCPPSFLAMAHDEAQQQSQDAVAATTEAMPVGMPLAEMSSVGGSDEDAA